MAEWHGLPVLTPSPSQNSSERYYRSRHLKLWLLLQVQPAAALTDSARARPRLQGSLGLAPIDHGFCLPEALEPPYFEWLHWPQVSRRRTHLADQCMQMCLDLATQVHDVRLAKPIQCTSLMTTTAEAAMLITDFSASLM